MDKFVAVIPPAIHSVDRTFEAVASASPRVQAPLIDRSPEARRARGAAARAAVAAMEAMEDGSGEDDAEFLRALDQSHPGRFDLARYYDDGLSLP